MKKPTSLIVSIVILSIITCKIRKQYVNECTTNIGNKHFWSFHNTRTRFINSAQVTTGTVTLFGNKAVNPDIIDVLFQKFQN